MERPRIYEGRRLNRHFVACFNSGQLRGGDPLGAIATAGGAFGRCSGTGAARRCCPSQAKADEHEEVLGSDCIQRGNDGS